MTSFTTHWEYKNWVFLCCLANDKWQNNLILFVWIWWSQNPLNQLNNTTKISSKYLVTLIGIKSNFKGVWKLFFRYCILHMIRKPTWFKKNTESFILVRMVLWWTKQHKICTLLLLWLLVNKKKQKCWSLGAVALLLNKRRFHWTFICCDSLMDVLFIFWFIRAAILSHLCLCMEKQAH